MPWTDVNVPVGLVRSRDDGRRLEALGGRQKAEGTRQKAESKKQKAEGKKAEGGRHKRFERE
jgi:hypothetical protein